MQFCELNEQEYTAFAKNHPYGSFMQSKEAYDIKIEGGWQGAYLGVKENGCVVAATLLVSMPVMKKFRYFYAQRGLLLDYNNLELLKYFLGNIKDYCHARKGLYLRIDPYVCLQERDINGDVVEGGFDNHDIVKHLIEMGCHYCGETTGFRDDQQVRWMFVLDLDGKDADTILKEMDQQTRWSINKTLKMGLDVRFLSYDELPVFKKMMDHTSERRGFVDRELEFYQRQMKCYGEENVKVPYATLDLSKYELNMQEDLDHQLKEKAEVEEMLAKQPNSKKFNKRLKVVDEAIDIAQRRLQEAKDLREKEGNVLPLATAFFITLNGNEVIYLSSGAYEEYMRFNGPYAIQWTMIRYALEHGYKRYNFYGTSGNFNKEAEDYGVYLFKKGFGGHVEELLGDFILPIDSMMFAIYNRLKKIV